MDSFEKRQRERKKHEKKALKAEKKRERAEKKKSGDAFEADASPEDTQESSTTMDAGPGHAESSPAPQSRPEPS